MATYSVRVELHDPSPRDHDNLNSEMQSAGFARTISGPETGLTYHLPEAEFNIKSGSTLSQILTRAKRAASKAGCKYGVLVTESRGRAWYGLKSPHKV